MATGASEELYRITAALAPRIADGGDTGSLLEALGTVLSAEAVFEDAQSSLQAGSLSQSVYRLAAPVSAGGEKLGRLSLLRTDRPFSAGEQTALDHAATLFAVHLAQQKRLSDLELRLKGNFVEDLVSHRDVDPDSIVSRAHALNFSLALPHRVMVGEIEAAGQSQSPPMPDTGASDFWPRLLGSIQGRLDEAGGGMAVRKNGELVLLVRQEDIKGPADTSRALAEALIAQVSAQLKVKLFIGIGSVCAGLADYRESYLQAKKALEVGAFMITEGQVRSFEQFKVHALFLSTLRPAELLDYARSQLGALLEHDARHQTELIKTLQEFLYLRNSVEKTAKSLSLSVSGLKYRLQRIERIIRLDLKDYKVCFDLQLALVILQLFGEYRIRNLG